MKREHQQPSMTEVASDGELERALRQSAARLRDGPAPHLLPGVLDRIRKLEQTSTSSQHIGQASLEDAAATPVLAQTAGRARLSWLGVAAALTLCVVLGVEAKRQIDEAAVAARPTASLGVGSPGSQSPGSQSPVPGSTSPAQPAASTLPSSPLAVSRFLIQLQDTGRFEQLATWLPADQPALVSERLEDPLLREVGELGQDAVRVANVVIEPLLRTVFESLLRPSLHDSGSGPVGR